MRAITGSVVLALILATTAISSAQVLKSEPPEGSLKSGVTVLVDDGTCGKGKIKQVTGGNNRNGGTGGARQKKCIAR